MITPKAWGGGGLGKKRGKEEGEKRGKGKEEVEKRGERGKKAPKNKAAGSRAISTPHNEITGTQHSAHHTAAGGVASRQELK